MNNNMKFCHSIKNKANKNIQCSNKPKINEDYCGKHINCKNKISFFEINKESLDDILSDALITNNLDISNIIIDNPESDDKTNKILSVTELFDYISKNKYLNIYTLRQSIKQSYLSKIINIKKSKSLLIEEVKNIIEHHRYYDANMHSIIMIQSIYRKWLIYKRSLCVNENDILTFTCKYEIPNKYFYIFKDSVTKKRYAYDFRTLLKIIESNYQSCPYTFRNFTDQEKEDIYLYKIKLINLGIDVEIEKKILSFEEETEMKTKDIFYEINMLDNYTNHFWFSNLELHELITLYLKMQDLWNYRTDMSIEAKKRIIANGTVFNVPLYIIKNQKSKIKLQNVILNEFSRLITEGINVDERKLGAMLILTSLVEVSHDAASALPHLIQNV